MVKHKRKKQKFIYEYKPPTPEYIYNSNFNLCIKESNIKYGGLGVFSNQFIEKNQHLGNYIGDMKEDGRFTCGVYAVTLESNNFIDAFQYPRTIFAMINDARFSEFSYNCEFRIFSNRAEVWSIRNINVNDELYFNYGDSYWKYR
tara:strand:- start:2161 stop:2595 length:435 start_codon:yes stop_codon:yes gene_type:complete